MNKIIDYVLVVLITYMSGNKAIRFLLGGDEISYVLVLIVTFVLLSPRKISMLNKDILFIISILLLICIVQYNIFNYFAIYAYLGVITKIVMAMLIAKYVPYAVIKYINVMFVISIISIIFFALMNIASFKYAIPYNNLIGELGSANGILLYDFQMGEFEIVKGMEDSNRNPGPFWEPGAFGGYLTFAFFLLLEEYKKKSFSQKRFISILIILVLAIVTTKSTTTYLCFFLIVVFFIDRFYSKTILHRLISSLFFLPPLLLLLFTAYTNLDFLQSKIQEQYLSGINQEGAFWYSNRFGNFIFNMEYIEASPLWGNGPNITTRFHIHPWMKKLDFPGFGNGFTEIIVKYGFVGFFLYSYFMYKGFSNSYGKKLAIFFMLIMSLQLQGEQFQDFPLFFLFMFLPKSTRLDIDRERRTA